MEIRCFVLGDDGPRFAGWWCGFHGHNGAPLCWLGDREIRRLARYLDETASSDDQGLELLTKDGSTWYVRDRETGETEELYRWADPCGRWAWRLPSDLEVYCED